MARLFWHYCYANDEEMRNLIEGRVRDKMEKGIWRETSTSIMGLVMCGERSAVDGICTEMIFSVNRASVVIGNGRGHE
jgi:hypothetical protein